MYLSKIEVDKPRVSISDARQIGEMTVYKAHKLACSFAGGPQRRYLYRLERDLGGWPVFYLLSEDHPRLNDSYWRCTSKEYKLTISVGDKLSFILRANPVKVHKGHGKRLDVMQYAIQHFKTGSLPSALTGDSFETAKEAAEAAGLAWLQRKAAESGFSIREAVIRSYERENFIRRGETVTIGFVDYHGVLEVTDHDIFRKSIYSGIGRAKGFGCGLMLVRRV